MVVMISAFGSSVADSSGRHLIACVRIWSGSLLSPLPEVLMEVWLHVEYLVQELADDSLLVGNHTGRHARDLDVGVFHNLGLKQTHTLSVHLAFAKIRHRAAFIQTRAHNFSNEKVPIPMLFFSNT